MWRCNLSTGGGTGDPQTGDPQTGDIDRHPPWWLWIVIPADALTLGVSFIIWRKRRAER